MQVKACACCGTNCRGGKQSEKRCSFCRPPGPNLTLILARHCRPDDQRQTGYKESKSIHHSLLPKHMRNVITSHCPVERLMEDALFPKNNRNDTQRCIIP